MTDRRQPIVIAALSNCSNPRIEPDPRAAHNLKFGVNFDRIDSSYLSDQVFQQGRITRSTSLAAAFRFRTDANPKGRLTVRGGFGFFGDTFPGFTGWSYQPDGRDIGSALRVGSLLADSSRIDVKSDGPTPDQPLNLTGG